MKKVKAIISVIMMLTLMTVTMAASPRVTFGSRAMSLKEAFAELEEQTGKSVAYNESIINLSTKVQTPSGEVSLEAALKAILKAMLPFMSGALGGLLSGCSVYGTGVGATL